MTQQSNSSASQNIIHHALQLEREAYELLREQNKTQDAFEIYDRAAKLYQEAGEHLKAAMCFASAATCWNIHTGWQPLHHAATRNHAGADAAMKAQHFEYAQSLYQEAAHLYEKEGDAENYSVCFVSSQRAYAKRQMLTALNKKAGNQGLLCANAGLGERVYAFKDWLLNTFGWLLWGYGERPFRTVMTAFVVIALSSLAYAQPGQAVLAGGKSIGSFFEAFYLSVVTFTTVGYGDYLAQGWARWVAMAESLSGIFLMPLFLIGLTRRYLRIYR
ncbi:MAG: hypothetical protein H6757_06570 [Candidatus Omnitrophica bacterium]|nr:hypothetical protein [Candidatus Omnitrophota bacterium]